MKIHSLGIENFRAIEKAEFDFTDSLSKPRTVTLIVGPNGSGKTSVLDAIHVVIRTLEDPLNPCLRDALTFSEAQLVRGRGESAKIQLEYSMEKEEAKAINEVFASIDLSEPFPDDDFSRPPCGRPAVCTWGYPKFGDAYEKKPYAISLKPEDSAKVLGARGQTKQAASRRTLPYSMFKHVGGVCYLDQRRSFRPAQNVVLKKDEKPHYDDILSWVYQYYRKDLTWNEEKYGESYWKRIQRLFNKICFPSELIGPESGPDSDTLILKKNNIEYDLLQMSSGEHQILRILIGLISETAMNSIVLLDEVELHLHPVWQGRLIQALREDDSNNQYIFTTHAPFVKQLFYNDEIIVLGDLGN
ncbi:MAG: AAA family ATPase [Gammaproteobacteria bacterium]|nr:AAA family ATPase [Gammaproteobacteria bacterium]